MNQLMDAFERDVRTIPSENFEAYEKGWEGQLGMALVDAVYSKQMLYTTKRGKGLLPRLLALQNPECSFGLKPPDSRSDLAT
jgi:hypothetical protein